jgi:dolichol-phosphate mannosyltransferase
MLPAFFGAVIPSLERTTEGHWSILCVDDGSRDETADVILARNRQDDRVKGLRLSRNFGHQAAVSVGLAYAQADYIGLMDCDLQDPVEVLVELYETAVGEDLDVCFGIRGRREAPFVLRVAYSLFYKIVQKVADHEWPRDAGDFCVMSARCHRSILSLPEQSRMLRGLRSWVGFRQRGVKYDRPSRLRGETKYNMYELTLLAMQGLTAFSTIPLRIATAIGLLMSVGSILFGVLIVINRLFPRFTVMRYWVGASPGVASVLVFLAFIFGVLFICLGIIGEYVIVLLHETKRRPTGIVESGIGDVRIQRPAYNVLDEVAPPLKSETI